MAWLRCSTDEIMWHYAKLPETACSGFCFVFFTWPSFVCAGHLRFSHYLNTGFTLEFTLCLNYEAARWDVGVLWQPCSGRMTPCLESEIQHTVTSTDLFAFPSPDLVGVGAGRAGEETETEEQAGAGHRHNGPEQLRTIQHLHLLLVFSSPLHLSLPLAPLTQQTKLQPPTTRQTNCKRTEAVYCKTGGRGSAEMGGPVYAYMCMCVCLSAAPSSVWAGVCVRDWDPGRLHTCTHGETCELTAFDSCGCWCFVVCLILISGVLSCWSDGQERSNGSLERNSIYGIISRMDHLWWANGERLCRSCDSNGCHSFKGC